MSERVRPEPPAPAGLDPLVETWPQGGEAARIYRRTFGASGRRMGPRSFNPGPALSRFRPVHDGLGGVVPTAYAASDIETALAETLLRGVEALAGDILPRLYRRQVEGHELAMLRPTRDLRLGRLHGQGLTRLGLLRSELIDPYPADHPYTARWAQALFACPTELDGLVWTSRQNDTGRAMVLWEGPLEPQADFEVIGDPLALDSGAGLELVREAALAAGFVFEG